MTLAEFLEWNPENGRYELINGVPTEMQPKGKHEEIVAFMNAEILAEIRHLKIPYLLPNSALIKSPDEKSGYKPDVLIIDRNELINEPLWEQYSTLTQGTSIPLAVEVVSSNWRDDYGYKMADYETLGIAEYWIIDYLGIGGKRFIGDPKQPTISVCQLIEDEYQVQLFREDQIINSSIFPALNLTPTQIFTAGN